MMERCSGCGAMAEQHPIVMIDVEPPSMRYVVSPVCRDCHEDPTHRSKNPLQGSFFTRRDEVRGLAMAGGARNYHAWKIPPGQKG